MVLQANRQIIEANNGQQQGGSVLRTLVTHDFHTNNNYELWSIELSLIGCWRLENLPQSKHESR